MDIEKEDHWLILKELINNWWRPLDEKDGISLTELVESEQRLGFKLPDTMREWYLMAGQRTDLINSQDHFSSPKELEIVHGNILLVCTESAFGLLWGIDLMNLGLPNPPVLVTAGNFISDTEEVGSFSFFITNMVGWVTMLFCKAKFEGRGTTKEISIENIKQNFYYLGFIQSWSQNESQILYKDSILIWLNEECISFKALDEVAYNKIASIINKKFDQ